MFLMPQKQLEQKSSTRLHSEETAIARLKLRSILSQTETHFLAAAQGNVRLS